MSRDRFLQILSVIQFGSHNAGDRVSKIKKIIEYMPKRLGEIYEAWKHVSIDERLIQSNTRTAIRQYIPTKAHRYGIGKLYQDKIMKILSKFFFAFVV